jgi:hypothetical protein
MSQKSPSKKSEEREKELKEISLEWNRIYQKTHDKNARRKLEKSELKRIKRLEKLELEEEEYNKEFEKRSNNSISNFFNELAQQTKRDPPNEKQYRKSILTSKSQSTKKGGKRRKPRKTKKHRKKKSL